MNGVWSINRRGKIALFLPAEEHPPYVAAVWRGSQLELQHGPQILKLDPPPLVVENAIRAAGAFDFFPLDAQGNPTAHLNVLVADKAQDKPPVVWSMSA